MKKQRLSNYTRIGDYIAHHDGKYVISLYRIDRPEHRFFPTGKLTLVAAQIRDSRGKLENVIR